MNRKHFSLLSIVLAFLSQCVLAQPAPTGQPPLPWSLAGNSNATIDSKLGTTSNIPLRIFTNNIERMRISENGWVGLGTTTPANQLHVVGSGRFTDGLIATNISSAAVTATGQIGILASGNIAVEASADGTANIGVFARNTSGIAIRAQSNSGYGVYATGTIGVYGSGVNQGVLGVGTVGVSAQGTTYGLFAYGSGTNSLGASLSGDYHGLWANGRAQYSTGVRGNGDYYGIVGQATSANPGAIGMYGFVSNGNGVVGYSQRGNGTSGYTDGSTTSYVAGVYGSCSGYGVGVIGYSAYGASIVGYSGGTYAGLFYGNVYSTGYYLGSDKKLKKNVSELKSALDIINQLKPKAYEFREDGNYKLMNLPKGEHYGLLAQDVEKVLPSLVKETEFNTAYAKADKPQTPVELDIKSDSHVPAVSQQRKISIEAKTEANQTIDYKAVNYLELIPIMIKGIQELTQENSDLKRQLNDLKTLLTNTSKEFSTSAQLNDGRALIQNMPNPVDVSTNIIYNLPAGTKAATLLITDNLGRLIKSLQLNSSGKVTIDASGLSSGVYNYSLLINGKPVETKKLIVQH